MYKIFVAMLCLIAWSAQAQPVLVIYDLDRKDYIEGKNADTASSIASITKLATAMVIIDANQDLDQQIEIRGTERSYRISRGTVLSRRTLLELMLITSDNLAANTLLEHYPGGKQQGIQAMNDLAKRIGANHTVYVDASGLSANNQSTAVDLIKILDRASQYNLIRQFSSQESLDITVVRSNKQRTWVERIRGLTTNPYLRNPQVFKVVVAKTGFTLAAGWCLAMIIEIDHRRFALVSTGNATKIQRKEVLDRALGKITNGVLESQFRDDGYSSLF